MMRGAGVSSRRGRMSSKQEASVLVGRTTHMKLVVILTVVSRSQNA